MRKQQRNPQYQFLEGMEADAVGGRLSPQPYAGVPGFNDVYYGTYDEWAISIHGAAPWHPKSVKYSDNP
jgi:hypothetical protein